MHTKIFLIHRDQEGQNRHCKRGRPASDEDNLLGDSGLIDIGF